jgi:hypothetical protein
MVRVFSRPPSVFTATSTTLGTFLRASRRPRPCRSRSSSQSPLHLLPTSTAVTATPPPPPPLPLHQSTPLGFPIPSPLYFLKELTPWGASRGRSTSSSRSSASRRATPAPSSAARGAAQVPPSPPPTRPTTRCVCPGPILSGLVRCSVGFDCVLFVRVAVCVLGYRRGRRGVRAKLRGRHARLLRCREDVDGGEFPLSFAGMILAICWHDEMLVRSRHGSPVATTRVVSVRGSRISAPYLNCTFFLLALQFWSFSKGNSNSFW